MSAWGRRGSPRPAWLSRSGPPKSLAAVPPPARRCLSPRPLKPVVLSTLALGLLFLHDISSLATVAASAKAPALGPQDRPLAIVNPRPFHSEVLSAALEAVRPLADRTAVYIDKYIYSGKDRLRDFVSSYPGLILRTPSRTEAGDGVAPHKVVFFLSPEVSLGYTRWFINASRPDTVVLMVHNADDPRVPKLLELHARARLVALSPHVAAALRQRGFQADWWLAAWDAQGAVPGLSTASAGERSKSIGEAMECPPLTNGTVPGPWGFTCQGRIDSRRRSYGSLWSDLEVAAGIEGRGKGTAAAQGPPRLKILGRSVEGEEGFSLPKAVRPYVTRISNAPYNKFYGHIRCSVALLTLFADDSYYDTKFSSTVLASLSTGTPILADAPFLSAYSFLNASTTWALQPGEALVRGMQRVAAEGWAQHAARRGALAALRRELNARAGAYLGALMEEEAGR